MDISAGALGPLLLARTAIDRSAALRKDEKWLERAWGDEKTRVVLIAGGETLIHRFTSDVALVLVSPSEAPEGRRYLLGVDADDVPYFAVQAPLPPLQTTAGAVAGAAAAAPREIAGLRDIGALLDDRDAGLLVYAVALEAWHATHEYCPRCGGRTEVTASGHMRVCRQDGSEHFPRVDPAVIMAVCDDEDRILLARGPQWPEGRMSVLAGFVEPGESLEHAVIREVHEEVGVVAAEPRYMGSQPWPFPRSLMLGFFARAITTEIRRDPAEIAEARWLSRAELAAAIDSGELRLPPQVSIARRLIETWYGDELPGRW